MHAAASEFGKKIEVTFRISSLVWQLTEYSLHVLSTKPLSTGSNMVI